MKHQNTTGLKREGAGRGGAGRGKGRAHVKSMRKLILPKPSELGGGA